MLKPSSVSELKHLSEGLLCTGGAGGGGPRACTAGGRLGLERRGRQGRRQRGGARAGRPPALLLRLPQCPRPEPAPAVPPGAALALTQQVDSRLRSRPADIILHWKSGWVTSEGIGEQQGARLRLTCNQCCVWCVIMLLLVQGRSLEVALEALLRGAESHIDPATRKTCVQVPSTISCGVFDNRFCIFEHLLWSLVLHCACT